MTQARNETNPFALMLDPASVIAAMERSERLSRLQSRICRPLDKLPPPSADAETASFDGAVDAGSVEGE